jgi:branched-subunit amino acid transport protein
MMWAAILLAGLASYLLRVLPLLLLGRVELPERVTEALQHAAMGAMAVILVTGAAHAAGVGAGGATGAGAAAAVSQVGRTLGVVAGVAVGLVLGRRGRSMPVVVLAALSVFAATSGVAVAVASRVG